MNLWGSHYGTDFYIYSDMVLRAKISTDIISKVKVEIVCLHNIILKETRRKRKGKGFTRNQEKQPDQNTIEQEKTGHSTSLECCPPRYAQRHLNNRIPKGHTEKIRKNGWEDENGLHTHIHRLEPTWIGNQDSQQGRPIDQAQKKQKEEEKDQVYYHIQEKVAWSWSGARNQGQELQGKFS